MVIAFFYYTNFAYYGKIFYINKPIKHMGKEG